MFRDSTTEILEWSEDPMGGSVLHEWTREGSETYTWSIRDEVEEVILVGSETIWSRWKDDMVDMISCEEGEEDSKLMLKSPSKTADLSLEGGRERGNPRTQSVNQLRRGGDRINQS